MKNNDETGRERERKDHKKLVMLMRVMTHEEEAKK